MGERYHCLRNLLPMSALTRTPAEVTVGSMETQTQYPESMGTVSRRELAANGYTTFDQLTGVSAKELLKIHGVGPKAIRILREELATRKLTFAGETLP